MPTAKEKEPPPITIKFKAPHRLYHALIESEQVMQIPMDEIIPLVLIQVLIEDYNSIESHRKLDRLFLELGTATGLLKNISERLERMEKENAREIHDPDACFELWGADRGLDTVSQGADLSKLGVDNSGRSK